jgi:DeoR family transcriptional regulator, fructose operon transcriptional repressor
MSKLLIPAQRRERIQEYLSVHKIARNADLCQFLEASEATVRRDLDWLESEGLIQRTHGGAMLSRKLDLEAEYRQRAQILSSEKQCIGELAASLVEDGETIFINSGTTTTQILRCLRRNADITVITNNLIAVLETGEVGYELILLGGVFQPKSNSVASSFAIGNLTQVYANKTFLGVEGINLKYGCTEATLAEAEVVRTMIAQTHGDIVVVADHSKWGVISNFEVAKIDQIQTLVTDSRLEPAALTSLRSHAVDILIADKIPNDCGG